MSLKLFQRLNGANQGVFSQFLEKHNGSDLKITWYPSANNDFRALLYCSKQYAAAHAPELESIENPDLFVFTDYSPMATANNQLFLENEILFSDEHTTVKVLEREVLPKLKYLGLFEDIKQIGTSEIQDEYVDRVYYFSLEVTSDEIGTYQTSLLYVVTFNEYFYKTVLLPTEAKIYQIIRVRYGGGCGGGGTSNGFWLNFVLQQLQVQCFITEEVESPREGDIYFVEKVLKSNLKLRLGQCKFRKLKTMPEKLWSNHGDVSWYLKLENVNEIDDIQLIETYQFKTNDFYNQCETELKDAICFKAFWFLFNHENDLAEQIQERKFTRLKEICYQLMNGKGFEPNNPFDNISSSDLIFLFEGFDFKLECENRRFKFSSIKWDRRIGKITFIDPSKNQPFDLFNKNTDIF